MAYDTLKILNNSFLLKQIEIITILNNTHEFFKSKWLIEILKFTCIWLIIDSYHCNAYK